MTLIQTIIEEKGQLAIAAFFGSSIAVALDYTGVLPAIRRLVVGFVTAMYTYQAAIPLTNFLLGIFKIEPTQTIAMSGFLAGVLGVVFIETLLLSAKKFAKRFHSDE